MPWELRGPDGVLFVCHQHCFKLLQTWLTLVSRSSAATLHGTSDFDPASWSIPEREKYSERLFELQATGRGCTTNSNS